MIFLIYTIAGLLSILLFYFVVKEAVKNGMLEAQRITSSRVHRQAAKPEKIATTEQEKLQQRYDAGEMSFEDYQAAWNRLPS